MLVYVWACADSGDKMAGMLDDLKGAEADWAEEATLQRLQLLYRLVKRNILPFASFPPPPHSSFLLPLSLWN